MPCTASNDPNRLRSPRAAMAASMWCRLWGMLTRASCVPGAVRVGERVNARHDLKVRRLRRGRGHGGQHSGALAATSHRACNPASPSGNWVCRPIWTPVPTFDPKNWWHRLRPFRVGLWSFCIPHGCGWAGKRDHPTMRHEEGKPLLPACAPCVQGLGLEAPGVGQIVRLA